jgi:hypothetical protein
MNDNNLMRVHTMKVVSCFAFLGAHSIISPSKNEIWRNENPGVISHLIHFSLLLVTVLLTASVFNHMFKCFECLNGGLVGLEL